MTLANHPDPADLVRVARAQALIATTTVVVSEAAAQRGGIKTGVIDRRNWARGCHSTEAAVAWLIRARGGRFVECGQPWLRTDDREITWLDAEVIARYSDAVSCGERHILALVEALALGRPLEDVGGLMASLDPYHLGLVLAVLRHAGCGSGSTRNSPEDAGGEYL